MKLHGSPASPSVMRALACLYEKEVEFEFLFVDMKNSQHKKEPFLSLNPFAKVPALEDGDLKLFESRAITHYVAHNYTESGTKLIYQDSKKMAIVVMWMQVETLQFDTVASKLTFEIIMKPLYYHMPTDEVIVEEYEAKLGTVLDVYEARLSESKYIGGDFFTLADLHHMPHIYYLMGTPTKKLFQSRPHVRAWVAEILARPAWLKVVAMQKK